MTHGLPLMGRPCFALMFALVRIRGERRGYILTLALVPLEQLLFAVKVIPVRALESKKERSGPQRPAAPGLISDWIMFQYRPLKLQEPFYMKRANQTATRLFSASPRTSPCADPSAAAHCRSDGCGEAAQGQRPQRSAAQYSDDIQR